jgi:hypothetical protein
MSGNILSQIGSFCRRIVNKASEAVENQEAAFVRGKLAANSVRDYKGQPIVFAGQKIDDAVIARAHAAGKLSALVGATFTDQARQFYANTPDRIEAHSLATSEDYLEARQYIGWTTATDVTDIRGNVLVPAGKQIEDADVRMVREADQLMALIFSARQAGRPAPGTLMPVITPDREFEDPDEVLTPPAVSYRTARPLADYFEEGPPEE